MSRNVFKIHTYYVDSVFAQGKFASVRICYKDNYKKPLAAKFISKRSSRKDPRILSNEQTIAAVVQHPNIVNVIDIFETQTFVIQISRLYENNLFTVLKNEVFDTEKCVKLSIQLMSAVNYLHKRYICHRDIKLENVLMSDDKEIIKLCDFGLSAFCFDGFLTSPAGSPLYIAPEAVSEKRYNGFMADIWSCGVLLFALMTRTMPYTVDFSYDIPPNFKRLDKRVKDIVERMLSKDPCKRPSAVEALDIFIKIHYKIHEEKLKIANEKSEEEVDSINSSEKTVGILRKNSNSVIPNSPFQRVTFGMDKVDESSEFPVFSPVESIDYYCISRLSQMLQTKFEQVTFQLKSKEPSAIKALYLLLQTKLDSCNVNDIQIDSPNNKIPCSLSHHNSCPIPLLEGSKNGGLMRTFQAESWEITSAIKEFMLLRNGCISLPFTVSRSIVLNRQQHDTRLSFDCYDEFNNSSVLMITPERGTRDNLCEEMIQYLETKFKLIKEKNVDI